MSDSDAQTMRPVCDSHAKGMHASMRSTCHVTGRYGTERKSRQDPGANPSVPDASGPVDNRESLVGQVA